jgi:hypothetical protein
VTHIARFLITLNFCFPFINGEALTGIPFELNIIPLLLAAILVPAICAYGGRELALLALAVAACFLFADLDRASRLAFNMLPFILCMSYIRFCARRHIDVLYGPIVYAAYLLFTALCIYQALHNAGFLAMPGNLVAFLDFALPRYMQTSYDDLGLRGVQGWASEPSGAALLSLGFYLYLRGTYPDHGRLLAVLYLANIFLNKSVYAFATLILLIAVHLITSKSFQQKLAGGMVAIASLVTAAFYFPRIHDVYQNIAAQGMSLASNPELSRLVQVLYPLNAFPMYYEPVMYFGTTLHPIGLFASALGYGSVFGMLLLVSIGLTLRQAFTQVMPYEWMRLNGPPAFFILFLAPANFVPVALCAVMIAKTRNETGQFLRSRAMPLSPSYMSRPGSA